MNLEKQLQSRAGFQDRVQSLRRRSCVGIPNNISNNSRAKSGFRAAVRTTQVRATTHHFVDERLQSTATRFNEVRSGRYLCNGILFRKGRHNHACQDGASTPFKMRNASDRNRHGNSTSVCCLKAVKQPVKVLIPADDFVLGTFVLRQASLGPNFVRHVCLPGHTIRA